MASAVRGAALLALVCAVSSMAGCRLAFDPSQYGAEDGGLGIDAPTPDAPDAPRLDGGTSDTPAIAEAGGVPDTAQYDTAQYDTAQYDTAQYDTAHYDTGRDAPSFDAFAGIDADSHDAAATHDAPMSDSPIAPDAVECSPPQRECVPGTPTAFRQCDGSGHWMLDTCGLVGGAQSHCYGAGRCRVRPSCDGGDAPGCAIVDQAGGTFQFGQVGTSFAAPPRNVRVTRVYVDAYEVTVGRFRRFMDAHGGAPTVPPPVTYPNGTAFPNVSSPFVPVGGSTWTTAPGAASEELLPVTGFTASHMQAFCVWDGGRLPTEAEWEWLARGRVVDGLSSGRRFPWGNADPGADCDRANWSGCAAGAARPVTMSGAAVGGLHGLAGNAFEWTIDEFEDLAWGDAALDGGVLDAGVSMLPYCWPAGSTVGDPVCLHVPRSGTVTRRGGGFASPIVNLQGAARFFYNVYTADLATGARCVYQP